MNPEPEALVWYVSYGSNANLERLDCYLQGGTPPGGARRNPGARDPRPPRRSVGVELPGRVYFAGESSQWGGGVAFYDPASRGTAYAVAHLLSPGQFTDIAAQEMYGDPHDGNPLESAVLAGETMRFGEGRYEHLVALGMLDGFAMLTFTTPEPHHETELNPPVPAYLDTVASGLLATGRWSERQVGEYLAALTGPVRGS